MTQPSGDTSRSAEPLASKQTICVYADVDAWRAERGLPEPHDVTTLLVDEHGTVRFLATGPPDPDALTAAASAASAMGGGSPA